MKSAVSLTASIVFLSICLLLLGGCGVTGKSAPTHFYVLSPLPDTDEETQTSADVDCIAIGIGPIELPAYVDRPQIVTRVTRNKVRLAEFDRWAEPVKDNFTRVLAENLSKLLCPEPGANFPWRGAILSDFRVSVDVIQFDGTLGGNAHLVTRWMIIAEKDKKVLMTRKSIFRKKLETQDFEALVAAQSQMIGDLCREIADGVKAILEKI